MPSSYFRHALGMSACLFALTGCVQPQQGDQGAYDPSIRTEVDGLIAQAGTRSANAQETLAMIKRARTAPAPSTLNEASLPPELQRKATIKFNGPAVEVARQIAANVGYGFIETGAKPAVPGMVTIDARDVSAGKALEDVSLQSRDFATIVVDPNIRRIEFRNELQPATREEIDEARGPRRGHPVPRMDHRASPRRHAAPRGRLMCNCGPAGSGPVPMSSMPANMVKVQPGGKAGIPGGMVPVAAPPVLPTTN